MNIPLNIDWQQILLYLLNFSVLTLGLYLLLYNPVRNFIEKRAEYYRKLDNEVQEKLKKAESLETSYSERIDSVEIEIGEKKALAAQQTSKEVDELLQSAKEQAAKIISNAQKVAMQERNKILEDSQQEIASMAIAATEKLIAQSASALDQFLDAVEKE